MPSGPTAKQHLGSGAAPADKHETGRIARRNRSFGAGAVGEGLEVIPTQAGVCRGA